MRTSLPELVKALKGLVTMSEELEQMVKAINANAVPAPWSANGFLSMKPLGSWVKQLNDRVTFLNRWIESGVPPAFWMSGLFFPQAFLTGTLQNFARSQKVAIDRLSFSFKLRDDLRVSEITAQPEKGVYVYGIFLEGSSWDGAYLAPARPKELYSELPVIHFEPVVDKPEPQGKFFACIFL
jgi:dynein heavy chain